MEFTTEQIEKLVATAMRRLGKKRDEARVETLKNMSREELELALKLAKPQKRNIWYETFKYGAVAAVAVVLIFCATYIPTPNKLGNTAANLLNHYSAEVTTFTTEKSMYNDKGALNTEGILNRASKNISKNNRILVRNGVRDLERLLQKGNYKKSLEVDIHWYLALGYTKQGYIEKAKNELKIVQSANGRHSTEATKLLKEL